MKDKDLNTNTGSGSGTRTRSQSTDRERNTNTEEGIESHRLTITRTAEQALVVAVEVVNDGYNGRINRNQLATWILHRYAPRLSQDEIKEIRAEHLDEISAFEVFLKRAKESGKLPPELRAFIQRENGLDDAPRKKAKKNLHENLTNDDIPKDDKAA